MSAHVLAAAAGYFPRAAILTFGMPIGIFGLALMWGFWERRPVAARRGSFFPMSGRPEHRYYLEVAEAQRRANGQRGGHVPPEVGAAHPTPYRAATPDSAVHVPGADERGAHDHGEGGVHGGGTERQGSPQPD